MSSDRGGAVADKLTRRRLSAPGRTGHWPDGTRTRSSRRRGAVERFSVFCSEHDPEVVAEGFLRHEIEPTRQHIGVMDDWLDRFLGYLKRAGESVITRN